jgi:hypothetical protein
MLVGFFSAEKIQTKQVDSVKKILELKELIEFHQVGENEVINKHIRENKKTALIIGHLKSGYSLNRCKYDTKITSTHSMGRIANFLRHIEMLILVLDSHKIRGDFYDVLEMARLKKVKTLVISVDGSVKEI